MYHLTAAIVASVLAFVNFSFANREDPATAGAGADSAATGGSSRATVSPMSPMKIELVKSENL